MGALSGEATLYAGPVAGGFIVGAGNSLIGGGSIKDALGQGVVGAATGVFGGMLGNKLSGVISSQLSTVVGSNASAIASNVVSSAAVGGVFGAGFAGISGGDTWQGFLSGLRIGATTGAISSIMSVALNKSNQPKVPAQAEETAPSTEKVETIKTEIKQPQTSALQPKPVEFKFDKVNGAKHFLKHARGLKYKRGEFIPIRGKEADMPTTLTLKEYTEGASKFFRPTNSETASFIGKDGRLYLYHAATNQFGVANPRTGAIITYYKPYTGYNYWLSKIRGN